MLWGMVIKIISMCFRIFLPSFRRVWFSSDDSAQSNGLSKRVTNMNPGHVKGVHDVHYVNVSVLIKFSQKTSGFTLIIVSSR